jgi:hypothetical protein
VVVVLLEQKVLLAAVLCLSGVDEMLLVREV